VTKLAPSPKSLHQKKIAPTSFVQPKNKKSEVAVLSARSDNTKQLL